MNKKIKFTALGISTLSVAIVPTTIIATNNSIINNKENKIVKKENNYTLDPFRAPSKLNAYDTIKWINIYGSFTAKVVGETSEKITFGVDLDTMGAVFRYEGAYVYLLKLNKKTGKYERTKKLLQNMKMVNMAHVHDLKKI